MTRKRITLPAIEKLESSILAAPDVSRSKVFGLVSPSGENVKSLYMARDGVHYTDDEPELFVPSKLEKIFHPKPYKTIYGGRGCLAIGTMVRMFDGSMKAVEEISVGDQVMGPDSMPRNVLSVCRGFDDMYTVHQKYADDYTVNSNHILSLRKVPSAISDETKTPEGKRIYRYYPNDPEILNIGIAEYQERASSTKFRHVFKGWRTGWDYPSQDVTVDPYFLGVWLGDGTSRAAEVCTPDPEIVSCIYEVAEHYGMQVKIRDAHRCPVYAITNGHASGMGRNKNPLLSALQSIGVINNKHIPEQYIKNSREVRMQILAGLLDTDAHYDKGKRSYSFTSITKQMSFAVMEIARSLGFKSSIMLQKNVTFEYKGEKRIYDKDVWTVFVSGDLHTIPCRVARKQAQESKSTRGKMTEVSVSYAGHGEFAGFSLDGDHLFLLEDGTVTHNSGKTYGVVSYLQELSRFSKKRIACLREIQNSIKDSSYSEIVDAIVRNGNSEEYRVVENEITHGGSGSKFFFRGMHRNITALKGMAGVDIAWCEEAESVTRASIDVLVPTIRKPGSEIITTFNPYMEQDPVWQQWVAPWHEKMVDGVYEDENRLIININWQDNFWFTDELRRAMQAMKETDYDRYLHIYEGKFSQRTEQQVFGGKWKVDDFEVKPEWHGPYFGIDFGFSQDATAMVEVYVESLPDERRNVYIYREHGKVGLEITDTPIAMEQAFPMARKARWYGDCSRPETISHIKRSGLDIHPCTKWPGSVEDGVSWLRGCDNIVIHESCKGVQEEAMMYSYKVDKLTGVVLTDIVDAWNHYFDAIRYSLNDHIVQRGSGWLRRRR